MTDACVMKATRRIAPWQVGHASGATSKICCRSAAHRRVASVGASRGAATIAGGPSAAAGAALRSSPAANLTLTVIVTGADRAGGSIGTAMYASADGFPNKREKAAQTSARPRTAPVNSVVFRGLTAGRYAVSVFHDQNSNTKLDTNLFGVPKEPWGTTGTVRPRMRAPRFEEAMINVTTDTRVEIRLER
jgi:uncharacterized protein (DUF2141 family)